MYIHPKMLEPTDIIGGAIAIYENAWINPEETINQIEMVANSESSNVQFVRAQTEGDIALNNVNSIRTNYHLALTFSSHFDENMRNINNRFYELISSASESYKKRFGIDETIFDVEGYGVLKYSGGQEYKAHYDGGTDTARSVSAILYLNDEYTGGEIEFTNFNFKIKTKPGTLLLFPSNYAYTHIAHPVETGTKYAIVTWLHDRN